MKTNDHSPFPNKIIFFILNFINIRMSQKFCNICMPASFRNKLQELEWLELMLHCIITYSNPWLTCVHKFQPSRGSVSFSEQVLCFKGKELVTVWNQKNWGKDGFRQCNMMASTLQNF